MKLIVILFWTGLYVVLTWYSIKNFVEHHKYDADIEAYTAIWIMISFLAAIILSILILADDI